MGFGNSHGGTRTDTFTLREGGRVLSEDYSHFLRPGEHEVGWAAREGRIPLGYFNDPDATRKTFPDVDGQRVVISGDRASLEKDGTLRLYGRDSLVVNTGGEKVFVEEVEEVLRAHPAVADALVVGRPSERWGEELVAVIELRDGAEAVAELLHTHCTSQLARFKAPKELIFVDHVHRLGNGKADYRWAKSQATEKAPMST
jgi:fatty-acyl-CoA synthase